VNGLAEREENLPKRSGDQISNHRPHTVWGSRPAGSTATSGAIAEFLLFAQDMQITLEQYFKKT
jgi:hypothetical protein